MKIKLSKIAHSRSGDKGSNSNVGLIFYSEILYEWAKLNLTEKRIKAHFKNIVKGKVKRYEMNNLMALNFILHDSLGGGGSASLNNDAQGKTHGMALLLMEVELPNELSIYIKA